MQIKEAISRGLNLLGVSIVGLSGFAFMPEIFLENDVPDKIDDITLLVIGVAGIIWYLTKNNRYQRSIMPVVLVVLALLTKIGAIIIEHADKDAIGDDMGALVLFVLATILVVYQYKKNAKLLENS